MPTLTIINDCRDDDAVVRQTVRLSSLFGGVGVHFAGVQNDLGAAGHLIDVLDALEDRDGIVLVNVAPRDHDAHRWPNGTPFGFFRYRQTLVCATIDGYTLSLVRACKLADTVYVFDLMQTAKAFDAHIRGVATVEAIAATQFRSFEFLPRVAAFIASGGIPVTESYAIEHVADVGARVWHIDNFGNAKTTCFPEDFARTTEHLCITAWGNLPFYEQLRDVPDDQAAVIRGSSGIGAQRFAEIVVQGKSAANTLGIRQGDYCYV